MPESTRPKPRRRPGRPSGSEEGDAARALLDAARELMATKGLPRVTVREVAARAGVQPALVNYHFGGKQGLLHAVIEIVTQRILEAAGEVTDAEGDAAERMRVLVHRTVASMVEDPYGPRLILEQVLFGDADVVDEFVDRFARNHFERVEEFLSAGRREGSLVDTESMFLVPFLFGGAAFFFLSAPILQRLFGIEKISPELASRFADFAVEVMMNGIGTHETSEPHDPTEPAETSRRDAVT